MKRCLPHDPNAKIYFKYKAVNLSPQASKIAMLACHHGFIPEQEQRNIGLLILTRGDEQINVYYTKMTVGTCVTHPIKGKTQLFRRNVTIKELEKIFANPRVHTGKGYYER